MPILKRDDGTQFAIHVYRELLQPAKRSFLRSEVRQLADSHGDYVRLFHLPGGQIEAVFSRDPGFLLGETVWEYFGKPTHLIYCEALPDAQLAMVVVVRDQCVYLDKRIAYSNINEEFAAVTTGQNAFDIYIYGDVPVAQTKTRGKFIFAEEQIKSFTQLDKPVTKLLPVNEALALQPLQFALREQWLGKKWSWGIVLLFLLFAIPFAVWFYQLQIQPAVVTQETRATPTDLYAEYRSSLRAPMPIKQMAELNKVIELFYDLPGWQLTQMTFSQGGYTIQLAANGGAVTWLQRWARNHRMTMRYNAEGVTLSYLSHLQDRSLPTIIYPLQQVLSTLVDRVDQVNTEQHSVILGKIDAFPAYKVAQVTIQLNNISPNVLALIGRQLADLPVKIASSQINIVQGLISGSVQVEALGS